MIAGSTVEEAWSLGKERFPGVSLTLDAFRAHAISRTGGSGSVHGGDLYLACACEAGDCAAHAHLASEIRPIVNAVASRFNGRGPDASELLGLVLERLLVARDGGPCRVAFYDGSHALCAWVRVIAMRLALDKLPRSSPERPLEDAVLDSLHAIDADPELLAERSRDGVVLRGAVESACRTLDPRSRRMLRHALVEGLTVDQIGALYGVHRATAARQVRRAMDALVESARGELGPTCDDGKPGGLSRIDLSLERWLRTTLEHARSA